MNVNDCVRRTQIVFEAYAQFAVQEKVDIKVLARGKNAWEAVSEQLSTSIKILEERYANLKNRSGQAQAQFREVERNKLFKDVLAFADRSKTPIKELEKIKRRANMTTGPNWYPDFTHPQQVNATVLKKREEEVQELYSRIDNLARAMKPSEEDEDRHRAAMIQREESESFTATQKIKNLAGNMMGSFLPTEVKELTARIAFGNEDPNAPQKAVDLPPDLINPTPNYYNHTDATERFEKEWLAAKQKQDIRLEKIEQGIAMLDDIAKKTADTLVEQTPLLDEVDQIAETNLAMLRTNNKRLSEQIDRVANSKAFCCYIILIILLLGVFGYMYTLVG